MKNKEPYDATRRIIVKFTDESAIPYQFKAEKYIHEKKIGKWGDLAKRFPGVTIQPLFLKLSAEKIKSLIKQATNNNPQYQPPNFLSYFAVPAPKKVNPADIAAAFNVKEAWPTVQVAYVESGPVTPPSVDFLCPAPTGIDVVPAWAKGSAGEGAGVSLVDIEQGWTFTDPTLPPSMGAKPIHGFNMVYLDHGTAVVSIVAGQGWVHGIAPKASVVAASLWHGDWKERKDDWDSNGYDVCSVVDALQAAADYLGSHGKLGDVILVESQTQDYLLPVETELAVFHLIEAITNAGYVVVEPAGNAGESGRPGQSNEPIGQGVDIDRYLAPDSATGSFKDSGAIVVGAALQEPAHPWAPLTNFGTRVNCFAWGRGITAAGAGSGGNFGGTSGASAIVAGVCLCVQGIAMKIHGACYKPSQLRQILCQGGTASSTGATIPIGVMPNLAVIVQLVNTTPPG